MTITTVNNSNSMSLLKITHPESKKNSILTTEVKEVKNISSPLLTHNNVAYETIDIGAQNKTEVASFSTFSKKESVKFSKSILEIKNANMDNDKGDVLRNYHFNKENNIAIQNNINNESKSNEYTEKRNKKSEEKLNSYRELYGNDINKTEDKNIENRYNLNSSDFSIIKNKIESKELSKKEKTSIIKKYLQDNDSVMKKMGFVEKIKNIFGKSEKINWIKREQATDALNILNKFIEDSENINRK
ncbi:hypothetical protein I4902_01020 [Proteus alimentorum]|uniref:Uncharacterized protein n=1 Tax=Proteus alimentorum TaxID=1973495 RepID=A0ABS0IPA9_9GAMM|nr:hypothetical protein [Proteus alimentorum]MBG2874215.1 hypothetical protein [Proteus alimentorum]MBG2877852.1 hypothetical protein [Proteus alimentorum]